VNAIEHDDVPRTTAHRKFGEWMKETREALGMSQARFGQHVGKSQSFIAKTETGERRMDIIEFVTLAEALGTSPQKLFQRVLDRIR
jgi:transcriptional regulator with XRE-family HTH domain